MSKYHYCISDLKERVFVSKIYNGWDKHIKQDSNGLSYSESEVIREYTDEVRKLYGRYRFQYQNAGAYLKHLTDRVVSK